MFKDGKARYTNQFVPSPRFSIERELGEQFFPQLGEYKGWLGLLKIMFHSHLVKEKIDDNKMVSSTYYQHMKHKQLSFAHLTCLTHSNYLKLSGCTAEHQHYDVQQKALLSS